MSINHSGLKGKLKSVVIAIQVNANHKLVKLANSLSWSELADITLPDLRKTNKSQWWRGRPIQLRTHLSVYLLQQLLNETDRNIERQIRDNAVYQVFCGATVVGKWNCPDHTKIEEFRSRLSAETQRELANRFAVIASKYGFADASELDIDSTVQEANMSYPADASLLVKLSGLAKKVTAYLGKNVDYFRKHPISIDFKEIKSRARAYFFSGIKKIKNVVKRPELKYLWDIVAQQLRPVRDGLKTLAERHWRAMPWNIKRAACQIKELSEKYIADVGKFLRQGKMQKTKILSFHLKEVAYFQKGLKEKAIKFGRCFQIGRIGGNFLFAGAAEDVRFHDKKAIEPMVAEHEELFGKDTLVSVSTDKGYFSQENEKMLAAKGIPVINLPCPGNTRVSPLVELLPDEREKMTNRRAGIEPLIGHLKRGWQMGKSKMKYDETTKAAGYCAVLGLNLRQLMRNLAGEVKTNTG